MSKIKIQISRKGQKKKLQTSPNKKNRTYKRNDKTKP